MFKKYWYCYISFSVLFLKVIFKLLFICPEKAPSVALSRPESGLSAEEEELDEKEKQVEEKQPDETELEQPTETRTSSRNSITGISNMITVFGEFIQWN